MDWFQHSTASHDDPDISDAWDEFGDAGYTVFFVLLELYGREFNHLDNEGFLRLSRTFVRRKLKKSWTKVEQILNFYQKRERIGLKNEGDYIEVRIPVFIDKASTWTRRQARRVVSPSPEVAPEAPHTASREVEVEVEVEVDKEPPLYTPPPEEIEKPKFKSLQAFEEIWKTYPNPTGKKAALKHFKASVKCEAEFTSIKAALKRYLAGDEVRRGFVQHGETWFNNWQDWIDPTEMMMTGTRREEDEDYPGSEAYKAALKRVGFDG